MCCSDGRKDDKQHSPEGQGVGAEDDAEEETHSDALATASPHALLTRPLDLHSVAACEPLTNTMQNNMVRIQHTVWSKLALDLSAGRNINSIRLINEHANEMEPIEEKVAANKPVDFAALHAKGQDRAQQCEHLVRHRAS